MDRTGIARALAGAAAASIVYAVVLTIVSGGLWIAAAIEWPLEQR